MKTIDYDKRAKWNEFVSEDTSFIRAIIKKLNAKVVLEIPCANGRNIQALHDIVDFALFGDINKHMIEAVQEKICAEKINNCFSTRLDLCDLSVLPAYADFDLILIMQQSFQLLSNEQAKMALFNMRKSKAKYILIDIYDFLAKAKDVPIYLSRDSSFLDSDGVEWKRKSSLVAGGNGCVVIQHDYISRNDRYGATVKLRNYTRKEFVDFCLQYGFTIEDIFTSYNMSFKAENGRTIVLLKN